jgi:hypothetical protein
MKSIQLSPNSLNLFLECPLCFWLEKNSGIKRPLAYPYEFNKKMDELLKEEFDLYRKKDLEHPLFGENNINAKLFKNQKLLNQWRSNLAGIRYFDQDLEATLFGAVDDVLDFGKAGIAPLDYKSTGMAISKIYDRFQLQMDIYTFLMEKNGYKTTGRGYLAFYVVDKNRGFIDRLPFNKEIIEIETNLSDIYEIFKEAVMLLKSQRPKKHSKDCQFGKWFEAIKTSDFNN